MNKQNVATLNAWLGPHFQLKFIECEPFDTTVGNKDEAMHLPAGYIVGAKEPGLLRAKPMDPIKLKTALQISLEAGRIKDPRVERTHKGIWIDEHTANQLNEILEQSRHNSAYDGLLEVFASHFLQKNGKNGQFF